MNIRRTTHTSLVAAVLLAATMFAARSGTARNIGSPGDITDLSVSGHRAR